MPWLRREGFVGGFEAVKTGFVAKVEVAFAGVEQVEDDDLVPEMTKMA